MRDYRNADTTVFFYLGGLSLLGVAFLVPETAPFTFIVALFLLTFSSILSGIINPYLKRKIYIQKSEQLKLDVTKLFEKGVAIEENLYLYLRPLALAETIQFKNAFDDHPSESISFEEALSRALDKPNRRYVFCVGDGNENWGVAKIVFENEMWMNRIVPLFKNVSAIISMPGVSDGCLNESRLIRKTPELCERTVFVIPPLSCYTPKKSLAKIDIRKYYQEVITRHASEVGLYFPDPTEDTGMFVVMDFHTGHPRKQLAWQHFIHRHEHKSLFRIEKTEVITPVLTADRIAAAVSLVA
jgi:hypothetical protein